MMIAFKVSSDTYIHLDIFIDGTHHILQSNHGTYPNHQEISTLVTNLNLSSANTGSLITFDGSSYANNYFIFSFYDVGGIRWESSIV